jgi:hypothetical protein
MLTLPADTKASRQGGETASSTRRFFSARLKNADRMRVKPAPSLLFRPSLHREEKRLVQSGAVSNRPGHRRADALAALET